jgi:hypothetical protein
MALGSLWGVDVSDLIECYVCSGAFEQFKVATKIQTEHVESLEILPAPENQ